MVRSSELRLVERASAMAEAVITVASAPRRSLGGVLGCPCEGERVGVVRERETGEASICDSSADEWSLRGVCEGGCRLTCPRGGWTLVGGGLAGGGGRELVPGRALCEVLPVGWDRVAEGARPLEVEGWMRGAGGLVMARRSTEVEGACAPEAGWGLADIGDAHHAAVRAGFATDAMGKVDEGVQVVDAEVPDEELGQVALAVGAQVPLQELDHAHLQRYAADRRHGAGQMVRQVAELPQAVAVDVGVVDLHGDGGAGVEDLVAAVVQDRVHGARRVESQVLAGALAFELDRRHESGAVVVSPHVAEPALVVEGGVVVAEEGLEREEREAAEGLACGEIHAAGVPVGVEPYGVAAAVQLSDDGAVADGEDVDEPPVGYGEGEVL
ncbi:protein-export membrane protein SecD [Babesia caballi]|uniref:Protein-export membrane protein SecD n=1 Tax=Babesia caballi TaxID=5871 RepID=A0AAV4M1S3_BABCB|nr:protein-export membrane protein SecD [Babesia caballi]